MLSNINPKINVYIKISCKERTKIPEKYKNLVQSTKFDFELLINNDDYFNMAMISCIQKSEKYNWETTADSLFETYQDVKLS